MSIWPQTTKTSNICISALIKNNVYNKIMLNFAGCLLMAFLILAMLQVAGRMYKILSFQHFSFRKRRFQCFAELWVMIIGNDFNPNSFFFHPNWQTPFIRTIFLLKLFLSRPHKSLLPAGNIRLDVNYELQYLPSSQVQKRLSPNEMEIYIVLQIEYVRCAQQQHHKDSHGWIWSALTYRDHYGDW